MRSENEIEVNDELIVKYLTGEAKPEEAMALFEWLEDGENRFHFEKLAATWGATHPFKKERPVKKDFTWEKFSEGVGQKDKPRQIRLFTIRLIAASVALIMISAIVLYLKVGKVESENIATRDNQKQVIFPDQSRVTLYHNTSITFPKKFSGQAREIQLHKGEAFFSVAPDKKKPFIIHADLADIKVVGTEFNVARKSDQLEVEVKEGLVLLSTAKDSVYLEAGTSAVVKLNDHSIERKKTIDLNSWAYATRKLVFNDTPIGVVIKDVEKAFSCSISVSNENIKKCKLTATFDNDPAEKIVDLIAESLNLSLRKNGRVFTLEGEGCP